MRSNNNDLIPVFKFKFKFKCDACERTKTAPKDLKDSKAFEENSLRHGTKLFVWSLEQIEVFSIDIGGTCRLS